MSENAEKMRKRHDEELKTLQEHCTHKKLSEWIDYHWAPGHILGKCRVCVNCDKIIEKTWTDPEEIACDVFDEKKMVKLRAHKSL